MPLDTARRLFSSHQLRRVAAPAALRLVGAVGCRNGPVLPGQPAFGWLVSRPLLRCDTIYDPWHYVPVLARKPGALRNGAAFKDWLLPASLERMRRKLGGSHDGTPRWSRCCRRC